MMFLILVHGAGIYDGAVVAIALAITIIVVIIFLVAMLYSADALCNGWQTKMYSFTTA